MERTKKMPESISFGDVKIKRNEFLVPSPTEPGKLIGLKSGKEYVYGAICYIGVEIFLDDIINKMKAYKIDIPDVNAYKITLGRFIDELYRYKISNVITSSADCDGNMILTKIAERDIQFIHGKKRDINVRNRT